VLTIKILDKDKNWNYKIYKSYLVLYDAYIIRVCLLNFYFLDSFLFKKGNNSNSIYKERISVEKFQGPIHQIRSQVSMSPSVILVSAANFETDVGHTVL
jgi:hypothetical protein